MLLHPLHAADRLVMLVEYGWDLLIWCSLCGRPDPPRRLGRAVMLGEWRGNLAAPLGDIRPRLKCPSCGGRAAHIQVIQGVYPDRDGPGHEAVERRAAVIRRVLRDAGIDPVGLGYP